mmetsp:Transcript_64115/g.185839  ORF Transcript_64115/g.185839 Transcript_64115/m.185839 type:complete len:252 (+) Transcript_64115:1000-1755(+)
MPLRHRRVDDRLEHGPRLFLGFLRQLRAGLEGHLRAQRLLDADAKVLFAPGLPVRQPARDGGSQGRGQYLRQRLLEPQLEAVGRSEPFHRRKREVRLQVGERPLHLPLGREGVQMDDVVRLSPRHADAQHVPLPDLKAIIEEGAAVVLPSLDRAQDADPLVDHRHHLDEGVVDGDGLAEPVGGEAQRVGVRLGELRRDLREARDQTGAKALQLAFVRRVGLPSDLLAVQVDPADTEDVAVSPQHLLRQPRR